MIVLTLDTETIEMVLGAAVDVAWVATWRDGTLSNTGGQFGSAKGTATASGAGTVVTAPPTNKQRQLIGFSATNLDGAETVTVFLRIKDGNDTYPITKTFTLPVAGTLAFDGSSWALQGASSGGGGGAAYSYFPSWGA